MQTLYHSKAFGDSHYSIELRSFNFMPWVRLKCSETPISRMSWAHDEPWWQAFVVRNLCAILSGYRHLRLVNGLYLGGLLLIRFALLSVTRLLGVVACV
ncbi:hypothetical protein BDN70DRAFT_530778 [Pholiota conissans]|uniref:Uncharacterized protein n=1 Tax=Pholiota conissans TaxID=109636 RepID=A0A9P5Z7H1_9AGAR|nr:hypothetical protein BDN70DRAFT_530778 [Pholiota conissans]